MSRAVVSGLRYREFVRVRLGKVGSRWMASPLSRGSSVVSSAMEADGFWTIRPAAPFWCACSARRKSWRILWWPKAAFIKKCFPKGGVRLVKCVGRTQRLIRSSGNPQSIRSL